MKIGLLFYGTVFFCLGVGITLEQMNNLNFSGFWFIGLGFILFIISMFVEESNRGGK